MSKERCFVFFNFIFGVFYPVSTSVNVFMTINGRKVSLGTVLIHINNFKMEMICPKIGSDTISVKGAPLRLFLFCF